MIMHRLTNPNRANRANQTGCPDHAARVLGLGALRGTIILGMIACAIAAFSRSAGAVEYGVVFGEPTVLSQQGQRLKVVVPVQSAIHDRATAASFMVRETEVPQGFQPPPAQSFVVMRPSSANYVVLQSAQPVASPQVALLVSVAGDPRSPYRMDLKVPPASARIDRTAMAESAVHRARNGLGGVGTRKLQGPAGESALPPK